MKPTGKQKQSSAISAKTAMAALLKAGYVTAEPDDRVIRPTERDLHRKNPGKLLSSSGKSVKLFYKGEEEGRAEEVFIPVKGMLSVMQTATLQKLAKITLNNSDN